MSYGYGFMFALVPFIFVCIFVFVFGLVIVGLIKGAQQWSSNNNSPVLTVDAKVATKRMSVMDQHHHHDHHNDVNGMHHNFTSTVYFVTFEVESGDRMEFQVPGSDYGMLAEGDYGRLTFQGTRYNGFQRTRS